MEKNRIRPVKAGKGMRMSYSRQKEVLEMPNLIEVQKDSYQWFLKEGLKEVFDDISPIADYSGHLSLEFVDFTLCESDVKYTIPEGTQSGTLFRLKGKGVPRVNSSGRGDQYVRVIVDIPKNLNEKQKDALKAFMEACGESIDGEVKHKKGFKDLFR